MSKHTPGPWKVVTEEHPHYLGGTHVERRIFTVWKHPQLKDSMGVVNNSIGIPAIKGDPAVRFVSIEEADAHLIASAPAMLEALEKYIAWCAAEDNHALVSFQTRNQMCRDAEDAARAAIRAAKGEA